MPSTLDTNNKKGIFALFKGESGTGKSVAALSFPKPFVFDFDRKMPAISNKHFPGKEVHWGNFEDIFEVAGQMKAFMETGCPFETLIFDSITTLSTLVLNSVGKVKGENAVDVLKSVNKKTNSIDVMGYDYYNAETNFIDRFLLENAQILHTRPGNPKHVIFLAHIVTVESAPDIRTKVITKSRSIVTAGRKSAAYIPTKFDEVYTFGYILPDLGDEITPVKRIAKTEVHGEDSAKTAYDFPGTIDFTRDRLKQGTGNFYQELCKYTSFEDEKVEELAL